MASKQTRRSCNLTENGYQRVRSCAKLLGRSGSSVLEALIQSGLEGLPIEDLLPQTLPSPTPKPKPPSSDEGPSGSGICMF